MTELAPIDLYDQQSYERQGPPYAGFRRLRTEDPVHWHDMPGDTGFWAITRYKDIFAVSLDQKTFSSQKGGVILRTWKDEEFEAQKNMLINLDPPEHTKYRRLVSMGFASKIIRHLEPHVREITNDIIDQVADAGECDFVSAISSELPLRVIVELMGVPLEDRHKVLDWSNKMIGFDDPEYQTQPENQVGAIAAAELFMYANALAEERLREPREDVISVLMRAEVDGSSLSMAEFNAFFLLLNVAGNETTRNLVSGGMLALMENPAERDRLLTDPTLIDSAVEEMLRWVTPVNLFRRTATRNVELGGKQIREGDKLVLFYASANRDESMFEDPERFDVGRTPNEHLAFGIGPHFCLGANLARLEIKVMFQELLRRLPDLELAGPVERLRSNFINGIKRMPVRFTPEHRRQALA
ncbi:MAG TPA: cytochrome P450 [Candidatus Binatia bacterium]|jgi:cholest-4-en-3-one 26-monooxygenase|nr:cytochrome P450 [Candidatus Binatia bacterium]